LKKDVGNFAIGSTVPSTTAHLSADSDIGQQHHLERTAAMTGDKLGEVSDGEDHTDVHQGSCLLIYNEVPHCEDACDVTDFPAMYDLPSRKVKHGCYDALGLNKVGQVADIIDDSTCVRGMRDSADNARLCLTTCYFEPNNVNTSHKSQAHVNSRDDTMITADQLRAKACENNILSLQQQNELYGVLIK
jgi:hypothetical protein